MLVRLANTSEFNRQANCSSSQHRTCSLLNHNFLDNHGIHLLCFQQFKQLQGWAAAIFFSPYNSFRAGDKIQHGSCICRTARLTAVKVKCPCVAHAFPLSRSQAHAFPLSHCTATFVFMDAKSDNPTSVQDELRSYHMLFSYVKHLVLNSSLFPLSLY